MKNLILTMLLVLPFTFFNLCMAEDVSSQSKENVSMQNTGNDVDLQKQLENAYRVGHWHNLLVSNYDGKINAANMSWYVDSAVAFLKEQNVEDETELSDEMLETLKAELSKLKDVESISSSITYNLQFFIEKGIVSKKLGELFLTLYTENSSPNTIRQKINEYVPKNKIEQINIAIFISTLDASEAFWEEKELYAINTRGNNDIIIADAFGSVVGGLLGSLVPVAGNIFGAAYSIMINQID
ncbi:MAG: hypothetical protein Q4F57_05075 [Weeksellaceae bacterium]|nr:hypothetical protein [Weeksellaceae bacterium]